MSTKTAAWSTVLTAFLLAASPAVALDVGEPAPPIAAKMWVSNTPVSLASAKGKILVVEFWATWCGPCKISIPRLNKLHAKYRDKQVVLAGFTHEDEDTVRCFLKTTAMNYHVAIDDDGKTHAAYMKDAPGIPHAFVADRTGKIVWQGHPLQGMDGVIKALVAGTFDPARARKLAEMRDKVREAYRNGSLQKVIATLDEAIEAVPDDPDAYRRKRGFLLRQRKHDEADQLLLAMAEACAKDPDVLAEVATTLATRSDLERRDMPKALQLAHKAVELSKSEDANTLSTLARVHYELGHLGRAASFAEKALNVATGDDAEALKARVAFYRKELARRSQDPDAK